VLHDNIKFGCPLVNDPIIVPDYARVPQLAENVHLRDYLLLLLIIHAAIFGAELRFEVKIVRKMGKGYCTERAGGYEDTYLP
jgi:hypothetical protein